MQDFDEAEEELAEWMGDPDNGWTGVALPDPDTDSLTRHHYVNILLWRIGHARRKLDAWQKLADAQKRMVDAWLERRSKSWLDRIKDAERQIDGLMRSEHAEDPKTKTLHLVNGEVAWREPPVASLVIDDEEAAVDWLIANGHEKAVKTTRVVVKDAVKQLAQSQPAAGIAADDNRSVLLYRVVVDDEIVPGCHFERNADGKVHIRPR